jgi:hypothetical protein
MNLLQPPICSLKMRIEATISSLITLKTLSFVCLPWKTVFSLCLEYTCRLIFEGVLSKNYVLKQKKKTSYVWKSSQIFKLRSAVAQQRSSAPSSFATTIFTPLELLQLQSLKTRKSKPKIFKADFRVTEISLPDY